MLRAVRSFFTAMFAVRRFGRACRLRDKGQNGDALALAQEALQVLRQPLVIRTNPAEAAVLSCAAVLVEGLSHELKQPGADPRDIADTLAIIRSHGADSDHQAWVPYLESRLGKGNASAV